MKWSLLAKHQNPTVEHIAIVIYDKIKKALDSCYEIEITLYETPRNYVVYKG